MLNMPFLDIISHALGNSVYVMDLHSRQFLYVSPHPLFLCGYSPDEARQLGYSFYPQIVPQNDLLLLLYIHKMIHAYLSVPENLPNLEYFIFNFRIIDNGTPTMVNHQMFPYQSDENPKTWIAACIVSCSTQKSSGNLCAFYKDKPYYFQYEFESEKWKKQPKIELSEHEKCILKLAGQGKETQEIADTLHRCKQTIKNQKSKLFEKLNVNSMKDALTVVKNYQLM